MKNDKPKIKIIIAGILIVILILVLVLFAIFNKKEYTPNEYKKVLELNKYKVTDKTLDYRNEDNIVKYLQSRDYKNNYQVDYFLMDKESNAKKYFKKLKDQIVKETNGKKGNSTTNNTTFNKYTIESSGNYVVIIRVNKTVIYVNANVINKEKVNKLINSFGY